MKSDDNLVKFLKTRLCRSAKPVFLMIHLTLKSELLIKAKQSTYGQLMAKLAV